jgi:hypothetical protein
MPRNLLAKRSAPKLIWPVPGIHAVTSSQQYKSTQRYGANPSSASEEPFVTPLDEGTLGP